MIRPTSATGPSSGRRGPGRRRNWRRRFVFGAVVALMATAVVVLSPGAASAVGTTLFDQPFHNNTANGLGTVVLPALPPGAAGTNVACLSATGNPSTGSLRSCTGGGATDPQGSGKLRLTDGSTTKTGGVFGAVSVPTSQGLDVTFNTYQWGNGGADGMAFALAAVDPANPAAPANLGQSGGGLGYAGTKSLAGLANGYLGIGLDVYGNYSTTTYEGTGCTDPPYISPSARVAGQVLIRGPGRGTVGYCAVNSTATTLPATVVPLRAASRAGSVVPVEVVINPTTGSFTTASGLVVAAGRYVVRFTPVGGSPRSLEGPLPSVAAGLYPSPTWLNSNGVPRQLAFGWVGGTGSITDNHEVDNAKVVTFNPVPDLSVAQTSYNGPTPLPDDPVTYSVVAAVDAGANETAPITVTETLPTGVVPVGAFGSGWVCAAPVGQKVTCVNSNTPFANATQLSAITIVGIVTSSSVTPTLIQTTSVATASSNDGNPGFSTATTVGTVPATPSGITVTPATSTIAGGVHVIVGGTNIAAANAIEIGTTAEQQAGAPVTLLPCPSGPAAGCFTVNPDGTLDISSMPARSTAATTTVTVVTRGVAGSASYVYTDKPATPSAPTAAAGLASATVTWVAPGTNGSPITSYILTPTRNGVSQTPITFDTSTTTRVLTGLTVGASYTFTVAAVNAIGTSTTSPASAAVVPFALPGAPVITAVSAGDSSATVTWTAPSTGGSPLTSYVVTPYIAGVAQTPQTFAPTPTTRVVTGLTPGTAYTFTVTATNAGGAGPPSAQSAAVIPNVSPTLSNPAPPAGEVGAPYSNTLVVTGGTSPFVWSVSAGTLPPGLTLTPATGLLSGTPTTAGSFPFTVRVTDAVSESATQALTVVIAPPPALTFPNPPAGQVGVGYSAPLSVTGGTGPFTWSVTAGSVPAGLTLNAGTGILSGTPTVANTYSFAVRVVDSFAQSATRTVAITITASPSLAFPPPPAGQVGVAYSNQLVVTGGTGPFGWSVSAGSLPAGLTLNASTGLLSGTPTTVGSYPFTVRVVDGTGQQATEAVTLGITTGPLVVVKTADVSTVAAGGTVNYSISVTNTASNAFTGVSVTDPLAGVLDDAAYNNDATANLGSVSFAGPTLTWTGDLAAGAVVTITYSVTVASPSTGDLVLANVVSSTTLGNNCAVGSLDSRCAVAVPVAALTIVKTADVATATPGATVRYTVTVTNAGQAGYTGAAITDALTAVLDDATYNNDATATAGAVSFATPNVTWTGNLSVGASATITYSVVVRSPDPGDKVMTGTVVSATPGNNCPSGGSDARCTSVVTVLVPSLILTNLVSTATATPGSTVSYTLTIANNGQTPYTGISVVDSLAGLLAHAAYNADATATSGSVTYSSPNLTWTGSLAVGATVTVAFSVTLSTVVVGDRVMTSVVSAAAAGNNCPAGGSDARCTATVTIVIPALTLVKTADAPTATPGSVVVYQIVVTNTGQSPYVGANLADSLEGVLDDAVYDANAAATAGVVTYSAPALLWTGDLAVGASVTITYSITLSNPGVGDKVLTNAVSSTTPGANCSAGSADSRCVARVTMLLPELTLTNTPSAATTTPGGTIGYTITIENTGQTAYSSITMSESLTDVLDDAVYNADALASAGAVGVTGSVLTWTGSLAVGVAATVTFSVTVRSPDPGSKVMVSTLTSTAAGSSCPVGGDAAACRATVTVLTPGLTITKTAGAPTTTPGGTIAYTISVANTGQTAYVGATFTDTLANPLFDSTYNNDAASSSGLVSYTAPTLTWVGDLAIGATATVTFSMTVRNPDPGDKLPVNTVVSTTPGSNCPVGSTDARCTAAVRVLVPGLIITTAANMPTTVPGSTVSYTMTITNSGQTAYPSVSVTDGLADVLDDASYNNNATASSGSVTFASPNLTWTGTLAIGASVTVSFSVTVAAVPAGDLILTSTAVSAATANNCPTGGTDAQCTVTVPVARLRIITTADVATTTPGGAIQVQTTITNTGQSQYTGISVEFEASTVADDVAGNGDETASSGTLTVSLTGAVWTGDVSPGATVTISGGLTVLDPDTGDRVISMVASSATPGNNCPVGSADPRCSLTVTVLLPGLSVEKVADTATTVPGGTVGYTVTVTNTGQAAYTAISVIDPLTGVLDDAGYNNNAVATGGAVTFTSPTLTWTGNLAVGAVVTITYSVTVLSPDPGDKILFNAVSSTAQGSSCSASTRPASCTSGVAVLTAGLTTVKSADVSAVAPGGTVTYTMTITNSGQLAYTGISVADDLTAVVDDAAYNNDANATAGLVSYTAAVLTWSGNLAVGATVTVTYTVTVDNPDLTGDHALVNTVTSAATGSNCPFDGSDPRCAVTATIVDATTLTFTKTANVAATAAGSVVQYTISIANSGLTPYVGASLTDSLTGVLDDADYNNDATATGGTAVGYSTPALSWSGNVPGSGSVIVTYSVTVHTVGGGDGLMNNTVVSPSSANNCVPASGDPRCAVSVTVSQLTIVNSTNVTSVHPGGAFTLTATFTNTGQTAYFGIVINLGGLGLLDDADATGEQQVSSGTTVIGASGLQWIGDIPVAGVVTVSGTFVVKNPDPGDKLLVSTINSAALGNNCPSGGSDPRCTVSFPVLIPGLTIAKSADRTFTVPGDTVGYTVTVTNTGESAYLAAVVTDALAGALDDATYNNNAAATLGTVSYAAPTLTWTGALAAGAVATITYTMTVLAPDPGDKTMVNRVSSLDVGSTCAPASANASCAVLLIVLTPGLNIAVSAAVATTVMGATVGFTMTLVNTGQTPQSTVSVNTSLADVLDDAEYDSSSATTGALTFTSPNLVWVGTLAPGGTATITYSVTVANPDAGDRILTSTVTSAAAGNTCPTGGTDPSCAATVTVSILSIVNGADVATTTPGGLVRYTTTVTNTGATPYTNISIGASFVGSLDDATYNGDAAASSGDLVLLTGTGTVRWTGDLAPGAILTVTGSFTVHNPDTANKIMTSIVSSAAPGNNCPTGGTDPLCKATVTVLVPGLAVVKAADRATTVPGAVLGYTITVTNTGQTPYTAANINDDLTGLLDDAAYNHDVTATAGVVVYNAAAITWTGNLATGAIVTITYTVTVDSPQTGARVLTNEVTSSTPGSSCPPGGSSAACSATVTVLVPGLSIAKTASAANVVPGGTLSYTITITNSGQTAYVGATLDDELTDVLDDASYGNNATASTGVLTYTAPDLGWTGNLAVGAVATITYSVTALSPAAGDRSLTNAVTSTTTGSNCAVGGTDPACAVTVGVLIPALSITNAADVATATPGDVIRFTATFTNTGPTAYTGTSIVTNASNVFDDAAPNGDQVASSGTLTVAGAAVTWIGDIPIGGIVTITGTVTVRDPDPGNRVIASTITTDAAGTNCPIGAPGPACTVGVTVLIPGLLIVKAPSSTKTGPGGVVGYTVTATNTGQTAYTNTTITDSLSGLLADASYNSDAAATTGVLAYVAPTLTWTGDLAIGAVVTITFSATVTAAQTGGRILTNTVSSTAPANNCPVGGTDTRCTATVAILVPGLTITKTADTATVTAGNVVTYTVTVANTGQSAYASAVFADALTGVLDDSTYNNDATASAGTVAYAAPVVSWSGSLAVGASAIVSYSVTVNLPDTGDQILINTVTSGTPGANCLDQATCTAVVAVLIPALTITKTADTTAVTVGDEVHYSLVITNIGQSSYTGATLTDSLAGVLDDASYGADATTTAGTLGYVAPDLTWTGDLPVGASAAITYTVTVHETITGDGHLLNAVTSTTAGNNCSAGSVDARCFVDVTAAESTITLASLPASFVLTGPLDSVVGEGSAVTMTVATNDPNGYVVTVRALSPQLSALQPANSDTIPLANLRVRENGTQSYRPLSDVTPLLVHTQSGPSAAGGDVLSNDFQITIPFVIADAYSVGLEYVAMTR